MRVTKVIKEYIERKVNEAYPLPIKKDAIHEEFEKLKGLDHFVINCVRRGRHISHFSLEGALEVARRVNAKHTWLTHLSHQLPCYDELSKELPAGILPAYDTLTIESVGSVN